MQKHLLSKTSFLKAIQCKKAIYLLKYFPKNKDIITEEKLMRFKFGHDIGYLAQKLFPNGFDITPYKGGIGKKALQKTNELIPLNTTIFEAAFRFNDIFIYLDILSYTENGWIAYEVKSSSSLKANHMKDGALQYYVIENSGLNLLDFRILYLDKDKKESEEINLKTNSFKSDSILDYCKSEMTNIEKEIKEIRNTLALPTAPIIEMGKHCIEPYECDFIGFCTKQQEPINEGLFKI